ncbi:methyl farnesoate epoxidase-like [Periplaneta americana]|uniref:methyl farnesoate epoxidase-like n=1 Tax=Periplaneta americana TaxID=6978 RepID=UPI0037E88DFA
MIFTLLLGLGVLLFIYYWITMKPKNFPPGPPYLPVLGSVLFIPTKLLHLTMAGEWRRKYGPLVGLFLGSKPAVAVCGPNEVLEVLRREEFQARPDDILFRDRIFGKKFGLVFSDGPYWVEQRRFTLRHLRDFGFGKKSMERLILDQVDDIVKEMKNHSIIQVNSLFNVSILNMLWGMIAGVTYERNDERLKYLFEKLDQAFRASGPAGNAANVFPVLMKIAPDLSGYNHVKQIVEDLQDFFKEIISEHEKTIDENNPRDLIDVYLREMKQQSSNPDTTFTVDSLIVVCLDLFIAGSETTSNTLGFSMLYMVLYPTVQAKVQRELDAVIGRDRRPSLEDRPRLPYVEAVLAELMRVSSTAPIAAPHRAERDTQLNGYFIPKDTSAVLSLYSLFQDKEHWGDPETFRPERFLDADGKFVRDDWMIPFSQGKRSCVGEGLARSATFLSFTTLMQQFTISVPEEDPKPSTVPLAGITITPAPFRIKITTRI